MWEKFVKCLGKGKKGKDCGVELAELYKRVPPNQRKQFKAFAKLTNEYKSRLEKYPSELPKIDWPYYKDNVRKEMVSWVDEFQKKYEQLDNMITNRHSLIDHSKYFGESEELTKCVEQEVKQYKEESDKRIVELQKKMEHLKQMKPYVEMTMEEYCLSHPNEAPDFINKPTFWPHTPEEQKPGPSEEVAHEEEDEVKAKSKDDKPKDPKDPPKTPPKTPPTGAAPGGKTESPADAKKDAPKEAAKKDTKSPASPPKKEEPKKEKASVVETTEVRAIQAKAESQTESQAVENVAVMASQGIELVKAMMGKAVELFKTAVLKMGEKRQQVTETAAAERRKVLAAVAAKRAARPPDDEDDDISKRETRSDICTKTIIRGEDTAKADVKPHHVDLDIESESEEEKEAKEEKKKQMKKHEECIRKCIEEDECQEKRPTCSEPKRKRASSCDDVKDKCQKPPKRDPCGKNLTSSDASMLNVKQEFFKENLVDPTEERRRAHASLLEEPKKPDMKKQNMMVMDDSKNIKTNIAVAEPLKAKPVQGMMAARTDVQQEIVCGRNEGIDDSGKLNAERVAKFVFEMATGTASLLSEAKNIIEKAQQGKGQGVDVEAAYLEAEGKVTDALNHAHMALDSAKGLAKQTSVADQEAIALIEKHAMLAQLLAYRAITMKKEIAKLLTDLRGI